MSNFISPLKNVRSDTYALKPPPVNARVRTFVDELLSVRSNGNVLERVCR